MADISDCFANDGLILADLHTHPSDEIGDVEIVQRILSSGVTGLAAKNRHNHVLTYEDALRRLPGVEESDVGIFAAVHYNGQTGYVVKAQEALCGGFHVLALGCRRQIPDYRDAEEAIMDAKGQGGIAVLAHPFLQTFKYGFFPGVRNENAEKVAELCQMADAIEVHNSQCVWHMKAANEQALELSERLGIVGIAVSDAHSHWGQVQSSGIYIAREKLTSFKALADIIRAGEFSIQKEDYVSGISFAAGHIGGLFIDPGVYFRSEH